MHLSTWSGLKPLVVQRSITSAILTVLLMPANSRTTAKILSDVFGILKKIMPYKKLRIFYEHKYLLSLLMFVDLIKGILGHFQ